MDGQGETCIPPSTSLSGEYNQKATIIVSDDGFECGAKEVKTITSTD